MINRVEGAAHWTLSRYSSVSFILEFTHIVFQENHSLTWSQFLFLELQKLKNHECCLSEAHSQVHAWPLLWVHPKPEWCLFWMFHCVMAGDKHVCKISGNCGYFIYLHFLKECISYMFLPSHIKIDMITSFISWFFLMVEPNSLPIHHKVRGSG